LIRKTVFIAPGAESKSTINPYCTNILIFEYTAPLRSFGSSKIETEKRAGCAGKVPPFEDALFLI
jgi:hypothetical protein